MSYPRIPYDIRDQDLPWLRGCRLLVHVVVNIEAWHFDRPMPRKLLTTPHAVDADPDLPNFCWAEYGMRRGLSRLARILQARDLVASASVNAAVIEIYPEAAELVSACGWEWVAHGLHQRSLQHEHDERSVIRESLQRIAAYTSERPRGWLGPGLQQSYNTPDILSEEGVDYVLELCLDDLPVWMSTASAPLLALPYSLELNDSVLHAVQQQPSDELYRRVVDTVAVFDSELESGVRIITLPLHPYLMGVPHRAHHLERVLDFLQSREDTTWVTGSELTDWYSTAVPPPSTM